jgi:hypothetical protein
MPRPVPQDADSPGQDSFLDIVANMVGILIILVMVVGLRAKNAPVAAISSGRSPLAAELENEQAVERALYTEVLTAEDQIRGLQEETLRQRRNRDALSLLATAAQQELDARRGQMDAEQQGFLDLGNQLRESRRELEGLQRRQAVLEGARPEAIVIESYPTPLSRTVIGHEAHFQLAGGRIVEIPLDELVEQLKQSAERQKYKLLEMPEFADTVGPLGGFRLRYNFRRYEVSPETAMQTGRGGSYGRLERWTLIPASGQLGEPVDEALAEGSQFRQAVAKHRAGRDTITVWTYEDSFASLRKVRKELYVLGFSVAARPLPLGVPIAGSPEGSHSAAE